MDKEKRKYPRRSVELNVELSYPSGDVKTVKTRDISEGGLFLILDELEKPVLGEVVGVKLVDESAGKEVFPSDEAVVVRYAPDGVGLAFIEIEVDDDLK